MMKNIYLMILSSAFIVCCFSTSYAAETATKEVGTTSETYVNKEKKYSIDYPAQWQKKDVPKLDLVLFAPPKSPASQTHASMNIVSENVGSEVTLDKFYTESVSNLTSQLKDVNIESSEKTTLNGVPSKWILYSHTMQGIKFRVLQYFIVSKDMVYLITFSSVADDFSGYRKEFEKIASSFRLVP